MNIKLTVTLKDCEGSLLRLLGTVERRGHRLLRLAFRRVSGNGEARDLTLEVDCGQRSPDVLVRQVRRLYDVLAAAWYECPVTAMNEPHLKFEQTVPTMYGLTVHHKESEESRKSQPEARRQGHG